MLAQTIEEFCLPRDLTAGCLGKSTYARCGVVVNTTPAEAEWRGHLTLEISHTAPIPVILYPGEGIAQMLFWRAADACEVSYADRRGRAFSHRMLSPRDGPEPAAPGYRSGSDHAGRSADRSSSPQERGSGRQGGVPSRRVTGGAEVSRRFRRHRLRS
jgi:hypothetical protein